jgi:uncharacterized protein YfaQ (DUF2300 family)
MPGNEQEFFLQSPLFASQEQPVEEIVLERVVVETQPVWTKRKTGAVWQCQVHAPPDLFHQERDETYQVQARSFANEARKKQLRPGDIVTLRGIPTTQEIETTTGQKRKVYHLLVTMIEVISRAKRVSLTVYERKRGW